MTPTNPPSNKDTFQSSTSPSIEDLSYGPCHLIFSGTYNFKRFVSSPRITMRGIANFKDISLGIDLLQNPVFCFLARKKLMSNRSVHKVHEDCELIFDDVQETKGEDYARGLMKHYQETGSYIWEEIEQQFYQNQLFIFNEKQLLIKKRDGILLHEFDFPKQYKFPMLLQHVHQCKKDKYILDLCLSSLEKFSTSYLILGPNKKYHIKTNFWR